MWFLFWRHFFWNTLYTAKKNAPENIDCRIIALLGEIGVAESNRDVRILTETSVGYNSSFCTCVGQIWPKTARNDWRDVGPPSGCKLQCVAVGALCSTVIFYVLCTPKWGAGWVQSRNEHNRSVVHTVTSSRNRFGIQQAPVCVLYVDFQKALDSVWRIGLWRVMFFCYEDTIVRLLEALETGVYSRPGV